MMPLSRQKTSDKPNVVHLLLERRWLGLGEKAQRRSLGNRSLAGSMIEGWGVRVHAVFRQRAKAEKALSVALKKQTEVEREGGLRERAQLMVKACEVVSEVDILSPSELGHPVWVNGVMTRRVYVVSTSVGESFSNKDLPPGLVEFDGNYFYTSAEAEVEAKKLEEQRVSPWGYPHNAKKLCQRPGEVLKVFSSPVGNCGANAYATSQALKDLSVVGFTSLQNYDLGKAVTYTKDGLAQVKMHRAERGGSIRGVIAVSEHAILDHRPTSANASVLGA
jgi:hypothetical protein